MILPLDPQSSLYILGYFDVYVGCILHDAITITENESMY